MTRAPEPLYKLLQGIFELVKLPSTPEESVSLFLPAVEQAVASAASLVRSLPFTDARLAYKCIHDLAFVVSYQPFQAIPGETRLEAASALSAALRTNASLLTAEPLSGEDVALLSHAVDRLLAAAEAWQHSDEAPAKRAALAAVQEIALARCGPPGSPECAAQGFPLAAAAPPDSADPCSTALSPAQALPPSVAAYLLPGTSTRLTKLLISANQSGAVEATAALASAVVAALRPEGADGDRVEEGVEHRVARTPQWVAETRPRVLRLLELACHSLQAGGASGPPAPLLRCAAADLALRISLADASNASNASADASATATASGGSALSFFEDSPLLSELLLALSADSWPQVRLLASSHLRRLSALSGERARGSRLAAAALRRALSSAADAAASGAPAAATLQLLRTARGALEAHGPEIASLELADRADSCGEVWAALGRILEPSRCRPLPQQDRQRSGDEAGPAGAAAAGRGLIGRFVEFRWLADEEVRDEAFAVCEALGRAAAAESPSVLSAVLADPLETLYDAAGGADPGSRQAAQRAAAAGCAAALALSGACARADTVARSGALRALFAAWGAGLSALPPPARDNAHTAAARASAFAGASILGSRFAGTPALDERDAAAVVQHAAAALAAPSAEVAAAAELLLSSCVDSAALAGLYSRLALCALRTRFESPQEAAAVQKLLDLVVAGGAAAGRGVAGVAALEDVLHSACAALQGLPASAPQLPATLAIASGLAGACAAGAEALTADAGEKSVKRTLDLLLKVGTSVAPLASGRHRVAALGVASKALLAVGHVGRRFGTFEATLPEVISVAKTIGDSLFAAPPGAPGTPAEALATLKAVEAAAAAYGPGLPPDFARPAAAALERASRELPLTPSFGEAWGVLCRVALALCRCEPAAPHMQQAVPALIRRACAAEGQTAHPGTRAALLELLVGLSAVDPDAAWLAATAASSSGGGGEIEGGGGGTTTRRQG